ncbi:MAG: tyrosine-type recombinase/integrase, partial [Endomicrobiales bacterium]
MQRSPIITGKFLQYLRAERNYSVNTLRAYRIDITEFFGFLAERYPAAEMKDCDRLIIREYFVFLQHNNLQRSSVVRKIAAVRSLFKYQVQDGAIPANPFRHLSTPKTEKKIPVFLSEDEIRSLFALPQIPVRDRAMLELLYAGGIRIEELVGLTVADIDFISGTIRVWGKGSKERIVPVGDQCLTVVRQYISSRREVSSSAGMTLFLNKQGKRISVRGARKVLHHWFVAAQFNKKVSPHTL